VPVIAIAAIAVLLVHFEWRIYAAGAATLLFSAAVYLTRNLARRSLPRRD